MRLLIIFTLSFLVPLSSAEARLFGGILRGLFGGGRREAPSTPFGQSSNLCRYGEGGQNENILECGDGIFFRGEDGIFRAKEQERRDSAPSPDSSVQARDRSGDSRGFQAPALPDEPSGAAHGAPSRRIRATDPGLFRPSTPEDRPNLTQPIPPVQPNSVVPSLVLNGALGKCVACHSTRARLPPEIKSVDSLRSLLSSMDRELLDEMIQRARLTAQEENAIRQASGR